MANFIDINFDFRADTPPGKDPDIYSATLRSYHKLLWSRPLPNGALFDLDDSRSDAYLYHESNLGKFFLSSDTVMPSFGKWKSMEHIISQLKDGELEQFRSALYTMGGMLIFPANRLDGKSTINGARGFNALIKDRLDLTLECIRRHYKDEQSPLADVLKRYADFFALFGDFRGYVEFFLLQDLVSEDFSKIKFLMRFEDFKTPAVPKSLSEYLAYKDLSIDFIRRRNQRILQAL